MQLLPVWAAALREGGTREMGAEAAKDAQRVLDDKSANATDKARAQAVLGMALKNQAEYVKAVEALTAARQVLKEGEWARMIDDALLETKDPASYYEKQADELDRRCRRFCQSVELPRRIESALMARCGRRQRNLRAVDG